jgi:hypothetical protein
VGTHTAHVLSMNAKPGADFSTFRITTSTEDITFHRSRTAGHSEAAVGDADPRVASTGCNFESHEPALILYADGAS